MKNLFKFKKEILILIFLFVLSFISFSFVQAASEVEDFFEEEEFCEITSIVNGTIADYPDCSIICNSGYVLSNGNCIVQGDSAPIPTENTETTEQTFYTSEDGTTVTTTMASSSVEGIIDVIENPTDNQTIIYNSSEVSEIQEIEIELPAELLTEIVSVYGDENNVIVGVANQNSGAGDELSFPEGFILIGDDIFYIEILVGPEEVSINNFDNYYIISFNVSGISHPENLSIGYFDEENFKWINLGGTLTGDILWIKVKYTGDFGLLRKMSVERDQEIKNVFIEAELVNNSGVDLQALLDYNGAVKSSTAEIASMDKYINKLLIGAKEISTEKIDAINNFIVYGTLLTRYLGAGERAGVINSYKSAFGKLPDTKEEWSDVIKIAIGRWPTERSNSAESLATENFKKIYLRDPDRSNPNDDAAVTVMAYGLRPHNRNLDSEKSAIKIFKNIFNYNPTSATDWDAVRAIAYSGAIR